MVNHIECMLTSGGSYAPNQFIVNTTEGRYFVSYQSVIAFKPRGSSKVYIGSDYDYSRTTMKYLKRFLGHDIKETRKRLDTGAYEKLTKEQEQSLKLGE